MIQLFDKLLFLLICLSFYLQDASGDWQVVPVVLAVLTSALGSLIEQRRIRLAISLVFVAASLYMPTLLLFAPLICLDLFAVGSPWLAFVCVVPILYHHQTSALPTFVQIGLLIFLAWLIYKRNLTTQSWREQARMLRDQSQEASLKMQEKQRELLEKQDYEINLARLTERNRIAREIHDNLGHQLSRAIIQLGALKIICRQENVQETILSLHETLTEGMRNIRSSVHDLHDQSISLEMELRRIAGQFDFCSLKFEYDSAGEPPLQYRYAFLAITKEALSNIIKHSAATQAEIILREHPAFYQLIITDNGQTPPGGPALEQSSGMGLHSMRERVEALGGRIHFGTDRGFRIFASLPKQSIASS